MTSLHPDVAGLSFLLGEWRGEGAGHYPTIEPFSYVETVEFGHVGKPFISYRQRTKRSGDHPESGLPLHAEVGYFRASGDTVELVIAQPSGIVEVQTGQFEGTTIHLRTQLVGLTPTAKRVDTIERRLAVVGNTLTYDLWMGAVGEPHQHHLSATLHRVE